MTAPVSTLVSDLILKDPQTLVAFLDSALSGKLTHARLITDVREFADIDVWAIYQRLSDGIEATEQQMNEGVPIPELLRIMAVHYFVADLSLLALRFWILHRNGIEQEYDRLGAASELTAAHHQKLPLLTTGRSRDEVRFIKGLLVKLVTVDMRSALWTMTAPPPTKTVETMRPEFAIRQQLALPAVQAELRRVPTEDELLLKIDALTRSAIGFALSAIATERSQS